MVVSLLLLIVLQSQSTPDVTQQERQVLLELFAATGGDSWREKSGWRSGTPVCDWYGVRCTFIDGDPSRPSVEGLSLDRNRLSGRLPESLADLPHLGYLSVSGNRLRGSIPQRLLERWDRHAFEFSGGGNQFDNIVARVVVTYTASGVLCSEIDDIRYRLEIDEVKRRAVFQSVRCVGPKTRETYCLVREGIPFGLERFSRALEHAGFAMLESEYDFPFSGTTHGVYLSTEAVWVDGTKRRLQTYERQGPLSAWVSQQLFLGLQTNISWERESRRRNCDFE